MKEIWNVFVRLLGYVLAAVLLILIVVCVLWLIVKIGTAVIDIWNDVVRMVMVR